MKTTLFGAPCVGSFFLVGTGMEEIVLSRADGGQRLTPVYGDLVLEQFIKITFVLLCYVYLSFYMCIYFEWWGRRVEEYFLFCPSLLTSIYMNVLKSWESHYMTSNKHIENT